MINVFPPARYISMNQFLFIFIAVYFSNSGFAKAQWEDTTRESADEARTRLESPVYGTSEYEMHRNRDKSARENLEYKVDFEAEQADKEIENKQKLQGFEAFRKGFNNAPQGASKD